jgi:HAE1 family hydrophobic/amphiphilic exporter-1
MGKIVDPKAFNDLVITTIQDQPIRIKDVGYAEDGTHELRSVARLWKQPPAGEKPQPLTTVMLEIKRQSGANSVEVIEGVKQALAKLNSLA